MIVKDSFLILFQNDVELKTYLFSKMLNDNFVFGIRLDEILVIFVTDFGHVVIYLICADHMLCNYLVY